MNCFSDVHFWRQSLILISDCLNSMGTGFMLSYSSILNPAILSPNSTDIKATPEEVSWLSASLGIAGVIGFCIIPPFFQYFGRKSVHIALNLLISLGFLCFYFSQSIIELFLGKFFQGIANCGVIITVIILAEYSHPKRRGYFMTIKKASTSFGALIFHCCYPYFTWRQMALVSVVPYILSSVLILIWPESPAFLAMKGKYEECDKSHTWLFGVSYKSKRDLEELITAQIERQNKRKKKLMERVKMTLSKFGKKSFIKPLFIVLFLNIMIEACGRYGMLTYIIEIVKEITGNPSAAFYCLIISDVFTLFAFGVSGIIIRLISRRKILIYFGLVSMFLTFLLSIIIFLKSRYNMGSDAVWLTPSLIVLSTFINYAGLIPPCFAIIGEIYPLEHRGIGSFCSGIIFTTIYGISVKLIPKIKNNTGIEGVFLIYGISTLISVLGLYFILIETKDRTLQNIEDEIKEIKRDNLQRLIREAPEENYKALN